MNTGKLNTIDDLIFYFAQVKGDEEFFGKIAQNSKNHETFVEYQMQANIDIAFADETLMLNNKIEDIGDKMVNILKDIPEINEIGKEIQKKVKANEDIDYIDEIKKIQQIVKSHIVPNDNLYSQCFEMLIDRFEWMKNLKVQDNLKWEDNFIECITENKAIFLKNPPIVSKELVEKVTKLADSIDIDSGIKHNFIKNIWLPILKFLNGCGVVSDDYMNNSLKRVTKNNTLTWFESIKNQLNDNKSSLQQNLQ